VGTAKAALIAAALAAARLAHADDAAESLARGDAAESLASNDCTGVSPSGGRFAACFDPGNRLSLTAATDGFGGGVALRHEIHFDDEPDLVWKLEHEGLDATYDGFSHAFAGVLYRGRFLRHARDGHIVIPIGAPKKVFLPFDIGALVEVGNLRWRAGQDATLGVVKTAALVDLSRSADFRRRFALGPVASWDVDLARTSVAITEHRIAPFSALLAEVHVESDSGLTILDLRGEAGTAWHTAGSWQRHLLAEASLERVVLAVNDRPIAVYATARYDYETSEALAAVGLRFVLFDRTDPRVQRL
jgi:hypothetical protein